MLNLRRELLYVFSGLIAISLPVIIIAAFFCMGWGIVSIIRKFL